LGRAFVLHLKKSRPLMPSGCHPRPACHGVSCVVWAPCFLFPLLWFTLGLGFVTLSPVLVRSRFLTMNNHPTCWRLIYIALWSPFFWKNPCPHDILHDWSQVIPLAESYFPLQVPFPSCIVCLAHTHSSESPPPLRTLRLLIQVSLCAFADLPPFVGFQDFFYYPTSRRNLRADRNGCLFSDCCLFVSY